VYGRERQDARRTDIVLLEVLPHPRVPRLAMPIVDDNRHLVRIHPSSRCFVRLEVRNVHFLIPARRVEHAPLYRLRGRVQQDHKHIVEGNEAL